MRGSRRRRRRQHTNTRSIPACAGEPVAGRFLSRQDQVDPRVCGGAPVIKPTKHRSGGRSPRVRGSRCGGGLGCADGGSIPACAGEPTPRGRRGLPGRVDPRVCGGAQGIKDIPQHGEGRSPRVRGSQFPATVRLAYPGSIPACAGEPTGATAFCPTAEVDPRVCGGAVSS